jgi:hypothetical protein
VHAPTVDVGGGSVVTCWTDPEGRKINPGGYRRSRHAPTTRDARLPTLLPPRQEVSTCQHHPRVIRSAAIGACSQEPRCSWGSASSRTRSRSASGREPPSSRLSSSPPSSGFGAEASAGRSLCVFELQSYPTWKRTGLEDQITQTAFAVVSAAGLLLAIAVLTRAFLTRKAVAPLGDHGASA